MVDDIGREKIIEHLTKEIEVITTSIMTFRTRAVFTAWIGPFILLGSLIIGTKGSFQFTTDNWCLMTFMMLLACAIYISLGIAGGIVEKQVWTQIYYQSHD